MTSKFISGEPVSESNPMPVTSAGGDLTDVSILASGSSQVIVDASPDRTVLNISNPDDGQDWWINETGGLSAVNGIGCFKLPPGNRWAPRPAPRRSVTGIAMNGTKLTVVVG